jgi:hypothetical protein
MNLVAGIIGILGLLVSAAYLPPVHAQEAAGPDISSTQDAVPDISLTLTETLNSMAPSGQTRDDIREIPPPRNDKLSDSTRVTVIVGTDQCLPGEDGWVSQRSFRRAPRLR